MLECVPTEKGPGDATKAPEGLPLRAAPLLLMVSEEEDTRGGEANRRDQQQWCERAHGRGER
jgi:hypothetical protein